MITQEFLSIFIAYKIVFISIPFVLIGTAVYFLILLPQKNQRLQKTIISNHLVQGATIITFHNKRGTIVHIDQHTVIIEQSSGEKIEVHKQTIKTVL